MTPRKELFMTGDGPPDCATITFLGMGGIFSLNGCTNKRRYYKKWMEMHNLQIGALAGRLTRRRTGGWRPRFNIPERTQTTAQRWKTNMHPGRKPVKQADMRREQERPRADKWPSRKHRQDPSGHADGDQGPTGDLPDQSAFIKVQRVTMILRSA